MQRAVGLSSRLGQVGQARVAQPALADGFGLDAEWLAGRGGQSGVGGLELWAECCDDGVLGGLEGGAEGVGVDGAHLLRKPKEKSVKWSAV
eukprot:scaffold13801_cov162-Isochrysis_galbana.AAC.5